MGVATVFEEGKVINGARELESWREAMVIQYRQHSGGAFGKCFIQAHIGLY